MSESIKDELEFQLVFRINKKQLTQITKWQKERTKVLGDKVKNTSYNYIFTPTGIGNGVKVKCSITNEELDVTDYDSW